MLKSGHICHTVFCVFSLLLSACNFSGSQIAGGNSVEKKQVVSCSFEDMVMFERERVITRADKFLSAEVRTVTADRATRSAGGPHDFFSEGDYWWPVPGKPEAPYERRDGESNPENFIAHRLSMMNLSDYVGTLTTAYMMTEESRYADAAMAHFRAWFITPDTRMNPSLFYAQAIKGRHTGRSIGIIDTMHLVDVAVTANFLIKAGHMEDEEVRAIEDWFSDYAQWMNTHPMGVKESLHPNNHSIAWSMQIAAFATLTENETLKEKVREMFKTWYLPDMMADDGSFPKETARTKPYGYSVFVYDLMAGIAQLLSDGGDNLWLYRTDNNHSMRLGADFIIPYMRDRSDWPFSDDVQYNDVPNQRRAFLLFAAQSFDNCDYFNMAQQFEPDPEIYEIRRNMPIRSPLLWLRITQ